MSKGLMAALLAMTVAAALGLGTTACMENRSKNKSTQQRGMDEGAGTGSSTRGSGTMTNYAPAPDASTPRTAQ